MLQEGQLQQFEAYCEKLYTSPDANERAAAEAALVQLSSSSEYIPQCQFVLDHSKLPYAQLVAANALKKLLMQSWNHLTVQQRVTPTRAPSPSPDPNPNPKPNPKPKPNPCPFPYPSRRAAGEMAAAQVQGGRRHPLGICRLTP